MDAILYIQAAREELTDNLVDETVAEANKASFTHIINNPEDLDYGSPV